jgi:Fe(3+) dicitrate transport protein
MLCPVRPSCRAVVGALGRSLLGVVAAVAVMFAAAVPAAAQSMQLAGRVVDVTGAVVPAATVVVRRPSGVVVASTTSDAAGRYAVSHLASGDYAVTAERDGFSLTEQTVRLRGTNPTLDLVLRPGALAEELTVLGARLVGSDTIRRRTAGAIDIVDSETLRASHVFSTTEVLRKVPGVVARDEEGLGLRPNIGIRGTNPTRSTKVLLLEDGLPVSFAPYGDNASYYHPPIERFERIEVLKGSSQIGYGPVTVGGVVNYITPEAPLRRAISIDLMGGNRAYGHGGVTFGDTWNRTGVFAHALRKSSDGARDNLHSDLSDVMLKVSHGFGATQSVAAKGNYYGERSQVTYSGLRTDEYAANPRQNPFANDDFTGDRWGFNATYRALAWARAAVTASAYTSSFARDWWRQSSNSAQRPNDAADPACGGMANLLTTCGNEGRLRSYRHSGGEVRVRLDGFLGLAVETDLGARAHVERQDRQQQNGATPTARSGVVVENNLRTTDALSAYVQQRWTAGALTVSPGARVERIAYTRTNQLLGVSGDTSLTELVPGVGVAYAAGAATTVFAGVHKGFAPPRAEDIINNTTGGVVELDPERSWNYEVGGRTRLGGVEVDATLFRLDYDNQIVPASVAGGVGAVLTNGGQTLHQGAELGVRADWRELAGSANDLYARVAYTWLPVTKFTGMRTSSVGGSTTVSVSGNRLPYAPRVLGTVTLGYRHAIGLDVQVEAQHVGEQFTDDLNTVAGTADGQRGLIAAYTYWNAAATWRLPRVPGSVFLAVKNLDDRLFIVDRSRGILPSHPRLIQVGTSWRF